jgi:long-subunit acyl-CoA synthetase (AMP-forming)
MEFQTLVSGLPAKTKAVYTLERGKPVRHAHADLHQDVRDTIARLQDWGVQRGSRVGIYAPNSYQWLVHDLALLEIGAISVPFTDDFAGAVNDGLLNRYNIALLLISKGDARLFPDRPAHVAFLDGDNGAVRALDRPASGEPDEDDHHSLVFSSGSAGGLKGLVISRKGVEATLPPIMDILDVQPGDKLLLFLPMSNFQQRNMCYAALWKDIDIIITDFTRVFAAMKSLSPTILVAPPVLFQMIHADFEKLPRWKQALRMGLGRMISLLPAPALRRALARRLFADFHAQFGSHMRVLMTGMAPIRRSIGHFFERMQLPLCESYGMVEAGSLTFRGADCREFGSVGKPLDGVTISFRDDGEIIVHRNTPMTLRYFQCAEGENERTFIGDGRIATGDIGRLDRNGNLFLLGRKKELIITPGGYKVHPEVIEQEMNNCPDVAHSVVCLRPGATNLTCVVDLVRPETDGARMRVKAHAAGLQSARKITQFVDVVFADAAFTKENGTLRPNLKIDRKAIVARYGA